MDKLIAKLKELAKRECWSDDPEFLVVERAGSNVDDAYSGGAGDGSTLLARGGLLAEFFPEEGGK